MLSICYKQKKQAYLAATYKTRTLFFFFLSFFPLRESRFRFSVASSNQLMVLYSVEEFLKLDQNAAYELADYSIDALQLQRWVDAHPEGLSRLRAKQVSLHFHYISYRHFLEYLQRGAMEFFKEVLTSKEHPSYAIMIPQTIDNAPTRCKSNFWVTQRLLRIIRRHRDTNNNGIHNAKNTAETKITTMTPWPQPAYVFEEWRDVLSPGVAAAPISRVLIADDAIYSGQQMAGLVSEIIGSYEAEQARLRRPLKKIRLSASRPPFAFVDRDVKSVPTQMNIPRLDIICGLATSGARALLQAVHAEQVENEITDVNTLAVNLYAGGRIPSFYEVLHLIDKTSPLATHFARELVTAPGDVPSVVMRKIEQFRASPYGTYFQHKMPDYASVTSAIRTGQVYSCLENKLDATSRVPFIRNCETEITRGIDCPVAPYKKFCSVALPLLPQTDSKSETTKYKDEFTSPPM